MSPHRVLNDIKRAFDLTGPGRLNDPGDAGTIRVSQWGQICGVVTKGAETRTLAAATNPGILFTIVLDTDGGDLILTVENGTNLTMDAAGEAAMFLSVDAGGTIYWKRIDTDTSPTQSAHISDPAAAAALTADLTGVDTGTDMTAAQAAQIEADLAALKTGIDANNAAVDAILSALESAGITASS